MKTILHVCDISAQPEEVWPALSTEEGLGAWWSSKVTADVRVGGIVDWTFEPGFNPDMEIIELVDGRRLSWKCVGGHEPWAENTFHFELEPLEGGRTRLRFRQEYATELSDDEYGIYNFNWGYYLLSIQRLAETGKGHPYSP